MLSIITLLIVLSLSILVTRIATIALTHTGLSKQSARFQARSAFTGVGFTTSESEKMVNHPVRRKILLLLMLGGNAGIITAMASLIVSLIDMSERQSIYPRLILLFSGLALLWLIASSKWVDRRLSGMISWSLQRFTRLDVRDYAGMLHLAGEYQVIELQVESEDWIADQELKDLRLSDEGIMILGVTRKSGKYIGAPMGDTRIEPSDTLILYGRVSALTNLDERKRGWGGDYQHAKEVSRHLEVVREQKEEDLPPKEENKEESVAAENRAKEKSSSDSAE